MTLRASSNGSAPKRSRTGMVVAASAAALAAAAVYNTYRARQVERQHPPLGRFIDVDGVRLHYLERGEGPPVVLLHGNVVTAEDWVLSGVLDRIAERHRVIAFDRPGYGYSERPQGSAWTAASQAELLLRAFVQLGIERPVVVGHSWGTNVALAIALADPAAVQRPGPCLRLLQPNLAGRRVAGGTCGGAGRGRRAALHGLAAVRRRDPAVADQGHVRAAAGAGALQGGLPARDGAAPVPDPRRGAGRCHHGLRRGGDAGALRGAADAGDDHGRQRGPGRGCRPARSSGCTSRSRTASSGWSRERGTWSTTRCRGRSPS